MRENLKEATLMETGNKFGYYFMNIIIFFGICYLLPHFEENPVAISVILLLMLLLMLPLNYTEYIFVNNTELKVIYKRVFFFKFFNRTRVFKFCNIRKITVVLKYDKKIGVKAFLINLTSKFSAMPSNTFDIEMNEGKNKFISSLVYKEKLLPLLNHMKNKGVNIEIITPTL